MRSQGSTTHKGIEIFSRDGGGAFVRVVGFHGADFRAHQEGKQGSRALTTGQPGLHADQVSAV